MGVRAKKREEIELRRAGFWIELFCMQRTERDTKLTF